MLGGRQQGPWGGVEARCRQQRRQCHVLIARRTVERRHTEEQYAARVVAELHGDAAGAAYTGPPPASAKGLYAGRVDQIHRTRRKSRSQFRVRGLPPVSPRGAKLAAVAIPTSAREENVGGEKDDAQEIAHSDPKSRRPSTVVVDVSDDNEDA